MATITEQESNIMAEREEMLERADALISSLADRKANVMALLRGEMAKISWDVIRDDSLSVDSENKISSNGALINLRNLTMPVMEQFCDDLAAIRTKVMMIVANLTEDEDESMFSEGYNAETSLAMKFMTIIQVIQTMGEWCGTVCDNWIQYFQSRTMIREGIDVMRLIKEKDFAEKDELCQSIMLLDCKMAKEMKSMMNTTLFHYTTLEDIVLDATGSVRETPQSPGYSCLYI